MFAGKMPQNAVGQLTGLASRHGLRGDELRFTGYVDDEELIQLYNLCELFVFPSWHEGFGLPALEAMACGAPVIGANTSSLPEVIGLESALFDPFDVMQMRDKIVQALTDDAFPGQSAQPWKGAMQALQLGQHGAASDPGLGRCRCGSWY